MENKRYWQNVERRRARIEAIPLFFPPGTFFFAKQVAAKFDVDIRTAYRYLREVKETHPIVGEPTVGYYHRKTA